jgi:hypothetical protein
MMTGKKKKGRKYPHQEIVYVDEHTKDYITLMANQQERSRSFVIRKILEKAEPFVSIDFAKGVD